MLRGRRWGRGVGGWVGLGWVEGICCGGLGGGWMGWMGVREGPLGCIAIFGSDRRCIISEKRSCYVKRYLQGDEECNMSAYGTSQMRSHG